MPDGPTAVTQKLLEAAALSLGLARGRNKASPTTGDRDDDVVSVAGGSVCGTATGAEARSWTIFSGRLPQRMPKWKDVPLDFMAEIANIISPKVYPKRKLAMIMAGDEDAVMSVNELCDIVIELAGFEANHSVPTKLKNDPSRLFVFVIDSINEVALENEDDRRPAAVIETKIGAPSQALVKRRSVASDIGVGHREHAEGSSQAFKNVAVMVRRPHSNHDEADSLVICFDGKSKLVERCSANSMVELKQFAVKTFSGLRKQLKRDRGLVIAMAFAYQGTEISLDDGDKLPRQCGGTPIVCKAVRKGETDDEPIDTSASSM